MLGRRVFLAIGLALAGGSRQLRAQLAGPPSPVRYARLSRPVTIPVEAVAVPWQPVPFVAEATRSDEPPALQRAPRSEALRATAARGTGRRVLISGVLFRTETDLSALCVTCPHEQCQVDLVTDESRLARMIQGKPSHPLFECGCHSSVFDAAADGARVSGESPRGLYRFRIAGLRDAIVEINEIEEAALSEV
jgi:Rieske Fe-S protein